MPDVELDCDIVACIRRARQISRGELSLATDIFGHRCVALVTPGRLIMAIPCPPASAVSSDMLVGVRQILLFQPKATITVIAFNDIMKQDALNTGGIGSLIPFLGYLLGMALDGNTVVAFEGHPSALKAGCDGADILIVDEAMAKYLQYDWVEAASSVMRTPRILVFGADGTISERT
jgi:hypothetical protein